MTYFSFFTIKKRHQKAPQTDQFEGAAILHEAYRSDNQIIQPCQFAFNCIPPIKDFAYMKTGNYAMRMNSLRTVIKWSLQTCLCKK